MLRSKQINNVVAGAAPECGLQLGWGGTGPQTLPLAAKDAGTHDVAFRFAVNGNVYVSELSEKVDLATRLGTVLTLLLSAMSALRVVKTLSQFAIDRCLVRRAKARKEKEDEHGDAALRAKDYATPDVPGSSWHFARES